MSEAPLDSRFHSSNDPRFEQLGKCQTCARRTGPFKCEAFPDDRGIPLRILVGDYDHSKPFPGDHGLQYVPRAV